MLIDCVRKRISAREASIKLKGHLRELRHGRLVFTVDFYVPYRCFEVIVINGGDSRSWLIAIDSVSGRLDPWKIDRQIMTEERFCVETRNVALEGLSEIEARSAVENLTRTATYLKGFFKVHDIEIKTHYLETLYMPYWVGVYERNNSARVDAINGLTGMREGAKLREVVTDWFLAPR